MGMFGKKKELSAIETPVIESPAIATSTGTDDKDTNIVREVLLADQDVLLYVAMLRGKAKYELLNRL